MQSERLSQSNEYQNILNFGIGITAMLTYHNRSKINKTAIHRFSAGRFWKQYYINKLNMGKYWHQSWCAGVVMMMIVVAMQATLFQLLFASMSGIMYIYLMQSEWLKATTDEIEWGRTEGKSKHCKIGKTRQNEVKSDRNHIASTAFQHLITF